MPVGQARLWAGEERATRNGGGPQGAALDSLLKEAITRNKGAPWEGAEKGRGIQGPGLLRKWGLDLAVGLAPPQGSKWTWIAEELFPGRLGQGRSHT